MKRTTVKRSPIKEKPLNQPGRFLDLEIELIRLKRFRNLAFFLIVFGIAGYEVLHAYFRLPLRPIFASILALASGIYLIYADFQLRKRAKSYMQGSLGEKSVGDILNSLIMPGVRVFHDLVIGDNKRNIDHVILSRRGIFVVETKFVSKIGNPSIHSNGEVVFGPWKNPDPKPIDQVVKNAKDLQNYIRDKTQRQFPVKPILVYPGWLVKPPYYGSIWVLNPKYVEDSINREPETISKTDYALVESWLLELDRLDSY